MSNIEDKAAPGFWIGFEQVLEFITLFSLVGAINNVLNFLIDKHVPDVVDRTTNSLFYLFRDNDIWLKTNLATLLVSLPVLVIISLILAWQINKKPYLANFRFRKVVVYLILVIAFTMMLGSSSSAVAGYLGGKSVQRIFYHWLVGFLSGLGVFVNYYILTKEDKPV